MMEAQGGPFICSIEGFLEGKWRWGMATRVRGVPMWGRRTQLKPYCLDWEFKWPILRHEEATSISNHLNSKVRLG